MALFGRHDKGSKRDRQKQGDTSVAANPAAPAGPPPPPGRTGQVNDGIMVHNYLAKGSRAEGKLHFEGTAHVDGQVEGEISVHDTLIIGEPALVTAQISGNTIVIRGKATGDIWARKRVEIHAPSKFYGNITTPNLVIHDGIMFEGHCSMGSGVAKGRS